MMWVLATILVISLDINIVLFLELRKARAAIEERSAQLGEK